MPQGMWQISVTYFRWIRLAFSPAPPDPLTREFNRHRPLAVTVIILTTSRYNYKKNS